VKAARASAELTGPVEDYLKVIFELEASGGTAGTNEIASALGIAAPSVSGMIRRLADQGLIAYERYRGARLTTQGRTAALRTIRRHRVIEAYLTTALGYPWDRVHDEAERLEHAASEELIDRMAAAIGEPATDPHGAPIPTREGTLDEPELSTLAEIEPGARARVQSVDDRDPARLRYLAELGILPGVTVDVVAREPFDGLITVRVGEQDHAIGPSLAQKILVGAARRPSKRSVD
jgi:DtxR family Mn-dependent transcriptional regulator